MNPAACHPPARDGRGLVQYQYYSSKRHATPNQVVYYSQQLEYFTLLHIQYSIWGEVWVDDWSQKQMPTGGAAIRATMVVLVYF